MAVARFLAAAIVLLLAGCNGPGADSEDPSVPAEGSETQADEANIESAPVFETGTTEGTQIGVAFPDVVSGHFITTSYGDAALESKGPLHAVRIEATWEPAAVQLRLCVRDLNGVVDEIPCLEGQSPLVLEWTAPDGHMLPAGPYAWAFSAPSGPTVVATMSETMQLTWAQ